jgi:hypothetical protein
MSRVLGEIEVDVKVFEEFESRWKLLQKYFKRSEEIQEVRRDPSCHKCISRVSGKIQAACYKDV